MARVNMQMAMEVKLSTVVSLTTAVNMATAAVPAMSLTQMEFNLPPSFLHLTHLRPVLRPIPSCSI